MEFIHELLVQIFTLQGWKTSSAFPFILFLSLLALTHLIYYRCFRHASPTVASGIIVMALGLYGLFCLPEAYLPTLIIVTVAFEVLIIWLYLGLELIHKSMHYSLPMERLKDRLSFGVWSSATAIVDLLLHHVDKHLHGIIILLAMLSVGLYVVYLFYIGHALFHILFKKYRGPIDGMIFMPVISTQIIVMLIHALFSNIFPLWLYQLLIIHGSVLYFISLFIFLRYLWSAHGKHCVTQCANTYTMLIAAASVTGFAILSAQAFASVTLWALWWGAFLCFVILETIEIWRASILVKRRGWLKGLGRYDVSQWTRVFSLVAFYGYSWVFNDYTQSQNIIILTVANVGEYVVTLLLVVELYIMLRHLCLTKELT